MARYIDAESLAESVNNWLYNINTYYHPHSKRTTIPTSEVFDLIETEPTADVRENVHGEWIEDGAITKCSVCGNTSDYCGTENFCHNCGADMRGEV